MYIKLYSCTGCSSVESGATVIALSPARKPPSAHNPCKLHCAVTNTSVYSHLAFFILFTCLVICRAADRM